MTVVIWREPWLKPLETGAEVCAVCRVGFVTSCEFCSIGVVYDFCAREHILHEHRSLVDRKILWHKDRRLHDYQ